MEYKDEVNKVFQKCLDKVSPEERKRTSFFMDCLEGFDNFDDCVIDALMEEGVDYTDTNKIINVVKEFYIKGICDAYDKFNK